MAEGNSHIASQFVEDVISGQARADVSMLAFRNPDSFVAGNLHNHFQAWERIANIAPFDLTLKILLWIKNCVDVQDFFQPFKGQYRGKNFDSTLPPHRIFSNALSCKPFSPLLSNQSVTINPAMTTSCLPLKAAHILISSGVTGTSPVTPSLSDGNRLPIFTIL